MTTPGSRIAAGVVALLAVCAWAPSNAAAQDEVAHGATRALWYGPAGERLPFASRAEAVDFLRSAAVVSVVDIPEGSTKPQRVLLEKDGVQAHAIFRSFERVQERVVDPDSGQTRFRPFRDSAMFEAAAYELATLLELPFVPPTVRRVVENRDGTLQLWIESAMNETQRQERAIALPNETWWRGVLQTLVIFDNLTYNADRNTGNLLIDPHWGVWFIDHTRAFQQERRLRNPEHITFCERRLFERLRDLTDEEIRTAMLPYLDGAEIGALLRRRARLVELIEELIEKNGRDQVLYDYSYDVGDWTRAAR